MVRKDNRLKFDLFHEIGFDHVALLDVLEFFKGDTVFVASGHFFHAVLKPLKRSDSTVVNDDIVPQKPHLGAPLHFPLVT